jgi:hypothetical protein
VSADDSAAEADTLLAEATPVDPSPATTASHSLEKRERDLSKLRMEDHLLDTRLKKLIGRIAILAMIVQLACTNIGFAAYMIWMQWISGSAIPQAVMIGWFSSTFVEIVGLVLVVAKYIFPSTGNNWNHEKVR